MKEPKIFKKGKTFFFSYDLKLKNKNGEYRGVGNSLILMDHDETLSGMERNIVKRNSKELPDIINVIITNFKEIE